MKQFEKCLILIGIILAVPLVSAAYTDIEISECTDLNTSGTRLLLTQSIGSPLTCFNVTANDVTVDCQGFTVYPNQVGAGQFVNNIEGSTGFNNTRIQNCIIDMNGTSGQMFYYTAQYAHNFTMINSTIKGTQGGNLFYIDGVVDDFKLINNNISSYTYYTYIETANDGDNAYFDNNTFYHSGANHVFSLNGDNTRFTNNKIYHYTSSTQIFHYGGAWNHTYINNTIESFGASAVGIFSDAGEDRNSTYIDNEFYFYGDNAIILDFNADLTLGHNNFTENTFFANGSGHKVISASQDTFKYNYFYNNIFNASTYIYLAETTEANNFNTTKTTAMNILGGAYKGGNAWFCPNGTGYSDTCSNTDFDGMCDDAYTIGVNQVDYLPLTYILSTNFTENSVAFNATSYETAVEKYILNATYNTSTYPNAVITLHYGGTPYATTLVESYGVPDGNDSIVTTTLYPSTSANNTFFWEVVLNATVTQNSSSQSQNVLPIVWQLCDATYNIPFLNYTFQDEESDAFINATIDSSWSFGLQGTTTYKSYFLINATENPEYTFCFYPDNRTVEVNYTLQYGASGYPQREYERTENLTSVSTNRTLDLLATGDGQYATFQVQSSTGVPISDVDITAERMIGSVWVTMETGTTDDAGSVTFWLNPDYSHRITAVKIGYTTVQSTITPSQTLYTIVMVQAVNGVVYNGTTEGLLWYIAPLPGRLDLHTLYHFQFNITASFGDMISCTLAVTELNGTVLNESSGCTAYGGNISLWLNTSTSRRILGKFYVDLGDGNITLDADTSWIVLDLEENLHTIKKFFERLLDLPQFGTEDLKADFSRTLLFFIVLALFIGMITLKTGWDVVNPGAAILILGSIVLFASLTGYLTQSIGILPSGEPNVWMNKFGIAFIMIFFMLGYVFHNLARST